EKRTYYSDQQLEEMLMGRKNTTFKEPTGLISRVVHSFFPRRIFTPFPVRNIADQLSGALTKTAIALICYLLSWFIVSSGLVGKDADLVLACVSFVLLIYLISAWRKADVKLNDTGISHYSGDDSVKHVTFALLLAILISFIFALAYRRLWVHYRESITGFPQLVAEMDQHFSSFSTGGFILGLQFLAGAVATLIFMM